MILKNSDSYSEGPSDLTIEFIRDPKEVTIIDTKPEFGWVVPNGAVSQSAYQMLLVSSKEKIDQSIGDIWDSGQVRGNVSINISHGGSELKTRG